MKATSLDRVGDDRRDDPAFAVADQADRRGIDLLSRLQEGDAREDVACEVVARRLRHAPGRTADAAVVDAEHGHASAREVVGQHEERLVLEGCVSSRSCAPEPLIRITAGNGPRPSGSVSVPARVTPASAFLYETSSTLYGKGAFGVCGRRVSDGFSVLLNVSGIFAPF